MANPVLVEVTRGNVIESVHRGAAAVVDGDGAAVLSIGDVDGRVFPRSAVKAIQALPLLESGAADACGFGNREIALACASHSGEPEHTALARSMLARAGLDEDALECGPHWPSRQEAALELARQGGRAGRIHNNCSGKHSGFVCTCRHLGIDHRGYVGAGHRSQEMVREAMEAVTGAAHTPDIRGVDGCSIPTFAVPLKNLALGFSRMTTGVGLGERRAAAARRILAACMAESFLVAGTDRHDTRLMTSGQNRIMVKTGAEGVYCGAVPELGLGFAIKCDDGAGRAGEVMVTALLARLLAGDAAFSAMLADMAKQPVKDWNGTPVGEVRPAGSLAGAVQPT